MTNSMGPRNPITSDDLQRSEQSREVRELRRALRSLPPGSLRSICACACVCLLRRKARAERSRTSARELARTWFTDFRLYANNLMRPLAIPTAGGFVSALLLFGVLAPSLATPRSGSAGPMFQPCCIPKHRCGASFR